MTADARRRQTFTDPASEAWRALDLLPGVDLLPLAVPVPEGSIHRARLSAGTVIPVHTHPADEFVLVLFGTVETGGRRCPTGTFWATPAGDQQAPGGGVDEQRRAVADVRPQSGLSMGTGGGRPSRNARSVLRSPMNPPS